ncbi:MAG: hypothetical protein ABSD31_12840 [Candidatus Binataceae bacterium]|jgi:hypothetical protein
MAERTDGDERGILKGIGREIDKRLGVKAGAPPHYKYIKSCRQLSDKEIENFDGAEFVESIYQRLEENWTGGKGSAQNWRWEPRPTLTKGEDGEGHKGAEVPFERTIAILSEMHHFGLKDAWTNQMPVASKLTHEREGKRAIDLVHRCRHGVYDFIELKLPGDKSHETPLAAAIEVLIYGLLYVFSRVNIKKLEYDPIKMEVLGDATKQINLLVVAPQKFYVDERKPAQRKYNLGWFQRSLNRGLAAFLKATRPSLDLSMSFQFEAIDDKFLKPEPDLDHGFSLIFRPKPVYL